MQKNTFVSERSLDPGCDCRDLALSINPICQLSKLNKGSTMVMPRVAHDNYDQTGDFAMLFVCRAFLSRVNIGRVNL